MGCLKLHTENNYTALKVVYSAVNTSVLEKQERKNTGAFLEVVYRNAQSGGGWVGPANTWNGGIGVLAGAVENLSGNVSLGKNGKFYPSGWGGNQYVSTAKVAKIGKIAGYGTLALGTIIDGVGVYNYYKHGANDPNAVHPGKAGLNLGVGVWGLINPATAIGAGMYYGIDTFYPGGWNNAMNMAAGVQARDRAILGFYPRD